MLPEQTTGFGERGTDPDDPQWGMREVAEQMLRKMWNDIHTLGEVTSNATDEAVWESGLHRDPAGFGIPASWL